MNMGSSIGQGHLSVTEKLMLISWPFLLLLVMVAGVGFISLYSAAGGNIDPWAGKHAVRFALGMCGIIVVSLIDIRIWMKLAYPIYVLGIALLIYVDIRGHIGMGAQRWISLGFLQLQPSEVMKIALVLALARFFHGSTAEDVRNPLFLLAPLVLVGLPAMFVMFQPDLGTAMTILMVATAIFFLAGVSYWMFGVVLAGGVALLPVAWHFLHDYQKRRVLVFLNPENDPLGAGYHITQSKIALGSGGITGKGFLQGSQSHLNFLPEKQTDFIFTLFTEEWGLVGGISLMALFAMIIVYGYFIAMNCQNKFARLLSMGVVVNFFVYIFINMGMVMGLLPVVGVPLPMISYGGTAMLSVMFGFGLLMSAHVHRDIKFTSG
ncbi:MAG: rod shape-determining protein RodA [Alphaproteobacteria bacterium]|nr:rod shape-determining protein RodA [Alphaproteobacteria bacterium]MCK5659433.1 rod shape-determining protein RodA [Alphaproteobacteria bacterium]